MWLLRDVSKDLYFEWGPGRNLLTIRTAFLEGNTLTNFLDTKFTYEPCAIDVLSPGSFTTIQDFPARATSGHGIPKGGPMDNVSSRSKYSIVQGDRDWLIEISCEYSCWK